MHATSIWAYHLMVVQDTETIDHAVTVDNIVDQEISALTC